MYLVLFAFIGLTVGLLAHLIGKRKRVGLRAFSMTAGVVGALGGGLLGRALGFHGGATELAGILLSIASAVALVMTYHAYARRGASA